MQNEITATQDTRGRWSAFTPDELDTLGFALWAFSRTIPPADASRVEARCATAMSREIMVEQEPAAAA